MRNDETRRKRKVGRPMWSGERTTKCDIRLNDDENSMLNELASRNGVTRSDVLRKALKDFYKFNN